MTVAAGITAKPVALGEPLVGRRPEERVLDYGIEEGLKLIASEAERHGVLWL